MSTIIGIEKYMSKRIRIQIPVQIRKLVYDNVVFNSVGEV